MFSSFFSLSASLFYLPNYVDIIRGWTLPFTDDLIIIFDPIPKVIKLDLSTTITVGFVTFSVSVLMGCYFVFEAFESFFVSIKGADFVPGVNYIKQKIASF